MELPLTPIGASSAEEAEQEAEAAPNMRRSRPRTKRTPQPVLPLRPPKEHTRLPLASGLLLPLRPDAGSAAGAGAAVGAGAAAGADAAVGSAIVGPPLVRASDLDRLVSADPGAPARVFAALDVHPDELAAEQSVQVVRYILEVTGEQFGEALELDAPGPLAIAVRGEEPSVRAGAPTVRECAERAVAAGISLVLPADATADDVADFQASFAHSPAGYLARAQDAAGVVRVLSCAVAGITGTDVRSAFARPDVGYLRSLHDMAADAVRELLLGVMVPDPPAVARELAGLGFGATGGVERVPDWYS